MPSLIAVLILLALILFWRARQELRAAGIPGGRVIYADTSRWGPVKEPLFDQALSLTGKPDYLVEQGEQLIPVEVKSSRGRQGPHDGHIFQLAAYCLLVQRTLGVRPPYGILHYPDRTYAIDYTPELESALLDLLAEIRRQERRGQQNRSHDSPARCRGCGFRSACEQRL
jgi:CRISPR-associated exonuclease Cas4